MTVDTSARSCPALLVAAPSSGAGKTSVTAALARLHARAGRRVRIFKLGPDYLDPLVLSAASGARVDNIDLWMVGIEQSRRLLHEAAAEADLVLVEGAMGLYDGDPSPADLAEALGLPVAVVIDAGAMAQTFGAVALGMRAYRPSLSVAGFIANQVAGPGHTAMLESSLPGPAPLLAPLLAAVGRSARRLPERHLGLIPPSELTPTSLIATLDALADAVDLRGGTGLPDAVTFAAATTPAPPPLLQGRTIAVAFDAAFCFVYDANLDCLASMGASIVCFSPLADEPVPADAHAVYLPGGYPELHAARLSANDTWQRSLRAAVEASTPVWAECGGMMVCFDALVDLEGVRHAMTGLLSGTVRLHDRVMAIGLQSLAVPGVQEPLRGHTFHVSTVDGAPATDRATAPHGIYGAPEPVHQRGTFTGSYFHAYFPSNPPAAAALFLPPT